MNRLLPLAAALVLVALPGCFQPAAPGLAGYRVPELPVALVRVTATEASPPRSDVLHADATSGPSYTLDPATRTLTFGNPSVMWDSCGADGFVLLEVRHASSVRDSTLELGLFHHAGGYARAPIAGLEHYVRANDGSAEFGVATGSLADSYRATPDRPLHLRLAATEPEVAASRTGGYAVHDVDYAYDIEVQALGTYKVTPSQQFLDMARDDPQGLLRFYQAEPRIPASCLQ